MEAGVKSGMEPGCKVGTNINLFCMPLAVQEGELSLLQQILHGISELQDDEKMLREFE